MALIGANNQQKKNIFEEINETSPNKLEDNKAIIEKWIRSQPHMPKNYDERILATFIRGCKHDAERVQRKLDHYFSYRKIMPELFVNRDPTAPDMKNLHEQFSAFPLPELTSDGCRITFHRFNAASNDLDVKAVVKYLIMLGEIRLIEEGPIAGDVCIFDVSGVSASMVPKLINPVVKKGIMCSQNALPQRVKEIHIFNAPPFMDTAVNIIKMFVKQKIKDRFHVYSDIQGLYKYIPKDALPSDYGGKEKSSDALQSEWNKKLESYRSYFEEQENICTDETKRMNAEQSSTEYNELFGTTGSFHKLSID